MGFELPPLPYSYESLTPVISKETLEFHHDKHHQAYVSKLNELVQGTPLAGEPLEEVIKASEGPLFNNAAQVWNHTFYWNGLKSGVTGPEGALADAIKRDFGSVDALKKALADAAVSQFGSGWAWLVLENGKLKVSKTGNADLPMRHGQTALWTIDVWEHAYYVDYRNARPKYVEAVLNNLMNWGFIARNYEKATK